MTEYYAFGPDAEVLGQMMLAFVKSTQSERIYPLLEAHGLTNVEPSAWYPQQIWLDVFSDLSVSGNAMFDFVGIGMQIVNAAELPPAVARLAFDEIVMHVVDVVNNSNRGMDAGMFKCERAGQRHLKIMACVPYPDDYVYGVFYGIAQRYLPATYNFDVYYDEKVPCRERGGEATILHIVWDAVM